MRGNRKEERGQKTEGGGQRLFFFKKILEDFIDVFSMTNVMDMDDMVLVVNFINNPKPSHF
jgi:hypothetical protein